MGTVRGSRLLRALGVVALLGSGNGVAAQHPTGGAVDPDLDNCIMCHGPHASRRDGVRPSLIRAPGEGLTVEALDVASRACLRCHHDAASRNRQPEFAGGRARAEGTYLGPTLLDDHPLGAAGLGGIDQAARVAARAASGRASAGAGLLTEMADADGVGCVACHDPHARAGGLGDRLEAEVCGSCHLRVLPVPAHPSLVCSDCHQLHGGAPGLLREPSDHLCRACHGTPATRSPAAGPLAVVRIDGGHHAGSGDRCTGCHPAHPAPVTGAAIRSYP